MQFSYIKRIILLCPLIILNMGLRAGSNYDHTESVNTTAADSLQRISGRAIDTRQNIVRYLYHRQSFKGTGNAEQITVQFLNYSKRMLGIGNPSEDLRLSDSWRTPAGDHLYFQQFLQNIPVYNGDVTVTVSAAGRIAFLASNFRPNLQIAETEPLIDRTSALQISENIVKVEKYFQSDPEVEKMVLDAGNGNGRLIYRIRLPAAKPRGDWEVLLDARTGEIIKIRNRIMYDTTVDGSGAIWDPDPLRMAGVFYGGPLVDPDGEDLDTPELNALRIKVVLKDITGRDGKYYLEGPFVRLVDMEQPGDLFPAPADPDSFVFRRSEQGFECVMVYYHIDTSNRYMQSLGYYVPGLDSFKVDPHGANGDDNSYYIGSGNFCVFGEGGVDDAEDASVIWHEYAHAIQMNIAHMSYEGQTAALQEGSADYWAASYVRSRTDFDWQDLFVWDAGKTGPGDSYGVFWPGRRCDLDLKYPDDYDFQDGVIHKNGQIWSSVLMHIQSEIGRETSDILFLQSHYLWGSSPGLRDAARAYIQADSLLYQGQHTREILYWFEKYGLVDPQDYIPVIVHKPLRDTEDLSADLRITATILSTNFPLDSTSIWLYWDTTGNPGYDSTAMTWDPDSGYFKANLPQPEGETVYRYYLYAADSLGHTGWKPGNAPDSVFSFHTGRDLQPPRIWLEPLSDQALVRWPPAVLTHVTDNTGIDSVLLETGTDSPRTDHRIMLAADGPGEWYRGVFPGDSLDYQPGQRIYYRISARDIAGISNMAFLPDTGYYFFTILGNGGIIVMDPESGGQQFSGNGDWQFGKPVNGPGGAFSGHSAWGTRLNDAYSQGPALSSLISLPVSLRGFVHAVLSLWQWYDIEGHLDGGNLKISDDQGATWKLLVPWYGYDVVADHSFGNPIGGQPVFSGKNASWHQVYYDLQPYIGKEIRLRFDFGSDFAGARAGWFLDSLQISDAQFGIAGPGTLEVVDNRLAASLAWKDIRPDPAQLSAPEDQPDSLQKTAFLQYYIHRSEGDGDNFMITDSTLHPSYRDSLVIPGRTYRYFIQAGAGRSFSGSSDTVSVFIQPVTGIAGDTEVPDRYILYQNFPNPFNPVTTFRYQIPYMTKVKIRIFDLTGRLVRILVDGYQRPGVYETVWDSENSAGHSVASGIYLVQMAAGDFTAVQKIILLK
jgi:Zn-dependent metalloprotease